MLTGSIARVPTYPAAEATTTSAISELSFILSRPFFRGEQERSAAVAGTGGHLRDQRPAELERLSDR